LIAFRIGALSRAFKPFMRFYTRKVIEQDVDIMKNQGENLQLAYTKRCQPTDADIVHAYVAQLRNYARRGDPKAFTMEKKSSALIWV